MSLPWFYVIPIWMAFFIILIFLLGCLEVSYRIGLSQARREHDRRGDVVLTAMLVMLGLILAFTYNYTVSRSDKRKAAVVAVANALGTAFARADLLDAAHREKIQLALYHYAQTLIVEDSEFRSNLDETVERILEKQAAIWPAVSEAVKSHESLGPYEMSMIYATNEVLDAFGTRFAAAMDRLPTAIHLVLLFIAGVSLSVAGYSAGRTDSLGRWRMTSLILVLPSVMFTIMDFYRPGSGFVQTSTQGYTLLLEDMERSLITVLPTSG